MSEFEDRLARVFRETFGLSEAAARIAARGRHGGDGPAETFDDLVAGFRRMGLSEAAAKRAAIGRDMSEHEARQFWGARLVPDETDIAEGSRPSGPAAMVAFYRLMGEVHAWREAAKVAETDDLRARANDRADAAFQEALKYVPHRHLEGLSTSTPVKAAESRRRPAQRRSLTEPRPRRG